MRLLDALIPTRSTRGGTGDTMTLADAYFGAGNQLGGFTTFSVGGQTYTVPIMTSVPGQKAEGIANSFEGYALNALMGNSVIFALVSTRMRVFSEARFMYQHMSKGRPADLWSDKTLALLDHPWPGGVTGDLLAIMLLHADFAGNAYIAQINTQLVALRPDWVDIILGERKWTDITGYRGTVGMEKLGYLYYQGGKQTGVQPVMFGAEDVAHFSPMPDPLANYRGMSWITPVIREIRSDMSAMDHKLQFFENAAAQPLDARILTPTGWTTMGAVTVGSSVVGSDGRPRSVLGVFPQGVKDVYRLTFAGGAVTECCEDHMWTVTNEYDRLIGRSRNLTMRQLLDGGIHYRCGTAKWAVPMVDPVEFDSPEPLPIDSYLLGVLLGDGSFRGNRAGSGGVALASHADDADEMENLLEPTLPAGVTMSRRVRRGHSTEFYFRGRGGPTPNPLTAAVRDLGLFDVIGHSKFIPAQYMQASVKDRVALLQGLIDTDGCVSSSAGAVFVNTSERLVTQTKELVECLGGIARMTQARPATDTSREQWQVYISQLPGWIIPCKLARKVAEWNPQPARRWRTLQDVELAGDTEVQCILIDHSDGLYVTDDCIVTHNTPNLAISLQGITDPDQFNTFVDAMDNAHKGVANAYKTLYLGAGADVTLIGSNFKDMDFSNVQGKGETRMASAAGVPPSVAGLSEGLQGSSLNAGNFGAARRLFGEGTLSQLWRNVCGSMETIVQPNSGSRLWYDTRDIPFLRADQVDLAAIQASKAQAIRELFMAGFKQDSIIAAVMADDLSLLEGQPVYSIQVQTPGQMQPKMPSTVDEPPPAAPGADIQKPAALPAGSPGAPPAATPAKAATNGTTTGGTAKNGTKP